MPALTNIAYTLIRKPIKHTYLRINNDAELVVSAPKHAPLSSIELFIESKRAWIIKRQQQIEEQKQRAQHSLRVFGKEYVFVRHEGKRNSIICVDGQCHLTTTPQSTNCAQRQIEERLITEYYRDKLRPIIHSYVEKYIPIIGAAPHEVRTKNMKTKWGTCNPVAKRLWFNVQLTRFSHKHIEYVVVHEMVHLLERSHNARFYSLVAQAMPDWQQYHRYLKGSCC